MELEINHFVRYLPYGLKISTIENEMISIDIKNKKIESLFRGHLVNIYEYDDAKPILRHMSDLTKEIEVNGEKFVPINELRESHKDFYIEIGNKNELIVKYKNTNMYVIINEYYNIIETLYEWHFDIHGLIEDGLAIDYNVFNIFK